MSVMVGQIAAGLTLRLKAALDADMWELFSPLSDERVLDLVAETQV